jgi:hypothetical protein
VALTPDDITFDSLSVWLAIIPPIGVKIELFSDILKL